ncbi:MAG TPA: substrate-binding domain-containing protein [Roseiarcus sp.]|jgi:ABC-type sugar transport system substrate-binding protein
MKRKGKRRAVEVARSSARTLVPGRETAVALLLLLGDREGRIRTGEAAQRLGAPRSSLRRICCILAREQLLDLSVRGWIALGSAAAALGTRRDEMLRLEDERRLAPRRKQLARAPGASYALLRIEDCAQVVDAARFRRTPKFRLGFSNASIDNAWRTALVHSVEYGAVRYESLVSFFSVRHARLDAQQQTRDIEALLASGIDGLILSAHESEALVDVLGEAERRGVPTVVVDRGRPEILPHVSFVSCDDRMIGDITARWLAERLRGRGSLLLLPGLIDADPAHRRLEGAQAVFARYPGLRILDICWTGWQPERGREIVAAKLAEGGEPIDGVWCDSGLQAVGSLRAYLAAGHGGAIPPHTGGDLNLAYKLAIRHGVPQAAVNYPPAMGLRSVEVLLEVLRGRSVPRWVEVPTEIVVTRGDATRSVRPDLWSDEHVRWDLPDDLILASGLGPSYDPRSFRVHYKGNRYNRSAADRTASLPHAGG